MDPWQVITMSGEARQVLFGVKNIRSEVNYDILRYVVELGLNFRMLLSPPKKKFPICRYGTSNYEVYL